MRLDESQTKLFTVFHYNGWTSITFSIQWSIFSLFFINNTLSPSLRICILSAGVAYSTSPPRGPNWGLSSGRWTWVIPGPLLLRAHLSWTPQVMALYLILPPALSLQRVALRYPLPPQRHCGVSLYFLEIESVAGIWNERNGFIRMDENV